MLTELVYKSFPEAVANTAVKVFTCESGINAGAIGDTSLQYMQNGVMYGASYGIAQIRYLPGRPTPTWLLNPYNNISYAVQLYKSSGSFNAWTCYKKQLQVFNPSKIEGFTL